MTVEIRSAADVDWPAMVRLAATSFGNFRPQEANDRWRTLIPERAVVVACDGDDVVGQALYCDLQLTVPGGAVLPMAGVSWVAVSPTHRRRGVLRGLLTELHGRMAAAGYPIAGLEASEAGIYGRFGYGPATTEYALEVDRRVARFDDTVRDPGGVRVVAPQDHRVALEELYERWRLSTPGGLHTPKALWDQVFGDDEVSRHGGSPFFVLLHDDGFVFYRTHGDGELKDVQVTKMAVLTVDAYVALWRTLLGMDLMKTIKVATPPDPLLPYLLTDHRLVRLAGWEDRLWLRILEVPRVLEARRYEADLSVVLDISGCGRFRLEVDGGSGRCAPTDADADVRLDRSVLGSLYLGTHRASMFAAANRLHGVPDVVARLDAAFASPVPAQLGYGF